jgi:molybdopterin molybdotransferase
MHTPAAALAEILRSVRPTDELESTALADACGRVLARDVASDVDLPPFEKSAMDGFAVRSADFAALSGSAMSNASASATSSASANAPPSAGAKATLAPTTLKVIGESRAGAPFCGAVRAGECVAIYTGAELPAGCDAVVMVEKSAQSGAQVRLDDAPRPGQHVCHRGEDLHSGATVLRRGRRISAIDLSVLAAVGCQPVPVFKRPRVALFTTGDELVEAHAKPAAGEIREGNTYYLAARLAAEGADVENHGIVRDDEAELERRFRAALDACDALVTTGGVSVGKYDLVGAVLERCGVARVFHKVAIKPGKPLWFGVREHASVFALPGNPVSCLIGFEVFVRPAVCKMGGAQESEWRERLHLGRWMGEPSKENARQQNLPVRVHRAADGVDELEPLRWSSSADIVGLTRADGLAVVEAGARVAEGELVSFRPLRAPW